MSYPADAEIENIVRLVVDRLRSISGNSVLDPASVLPAPDNAVLRLPGKVISSRDLEGQLQGVKRIRIRPDALMTPVVRDELSRRQICIERITEEPLAPASHGVPPIQHTTKQIKIVLSAHRSTVLQSLLKDCTFQLESRARRACELVEELVADWNVERFVIWLTDQPYAISVSVSQHALESIRPVFLHDLTELQIAIQQAQPNLLVLDEKRWTTNQVVQAVRLLGKQVLTR